MKAKTEELLYLLLWAAETLTRPTFRNLTESFEGWCYRTGLHRQLAELERRDLLERNPGLAEPAFRLTQKGRLLALGGRDPVAQWARPWDGHWRVVIFDLPEKQASRRVNLRRFLHEHGFGYLQKSVWVRPDPVTGLAQQLAAFSADVETLITLEARSGAGESNSAIVAGAWDFAAINRLYQASARVLERLPAASGRDPDGAVQLQRWARLERAAWSAAVIADPLLPACLLPCGYLGREVWNLRVGVLHEAAKRRG